MKLRNLLSGLILIALFATVSTARAEEGIKPKISALPFKTCHIVYKTTSTDSVSAEKRITGLWELYIDVPNNRLTISKKHEPSNNTAKQDNLWARRIFRDGEWLEFGGSRSGKYARVPAQIDPLLEEFNAHYCAPYPSIKKPIQGRESVGCKRRDGIRDTEQYFWNNILMEETSKLRFIGSTSRTTIVSFETDAPIDAAVFEVAPELIVDEAEVYEERPKSTEKDRILVAGAGQRLRIQALAAVDSKYAEILPAKDVKPEDIDWKTVYERADALDREWAKSLGWSIEPQQSVSDFITGNKDKASFASDYHLTLYRSAKNALNESSEKPLGELSAAIRKNPYDSTLFGERASLYAKVSKYQEALQDTNQSIRLSFRRWPSAESDVVRRLLQRAAVYCRLDRCEESTHDITLIIQHEEGRKLQRLENLQSLAEKSGEKKAAYIPENEDVWLAEHYETRGDVNYHCQRDNEALSDYLSGLKSFTLSDPSDQKWSSRIEEVRRTLLLKAAYLSGRVHRANEGLKLLEQFTATLEYDKDRGKDFERDANYIRFYLHRQLKQQQELMQDLKLIGGDDLVGKYSYIQSGLMLLRARQYDKVSDDFVCWIGSGITRRDFESEVFRDDFEEMKYELARFPGKPDCVGKAVSQLDGIKLRHFHYSLEMSCPRI